MKSKHLLFFYLALMVGLVLVALLFPSQFLALIERPEWYVHAKFVHILSVTLVFANAVIGTIWEMRSLLSGKPEIIRYTYKTVTWLDGVFTAPLILISLVSGLMLGTVLGGVFSIGWLSLAFSLYVFSGVVWVIIDIPTQFRVNRLFNEVPYDALSLPLPLTKLLWWRMGINFLGMLPLLAIFFLMVHKPQI